MRTSRIAQVLKDLPIIMNPRTELVFKTDDGFATTSRVIAQTFNKRHRDVLKSIKNLKCSEDFTERNFALSTYSDTSGKKNPEYIIKRDGFSFLAMGFTGKDAAVWKEKFIEQFNAMESTIQNYSDDPFIALRINQIQQEAKLAAQEKKLKHQESRIDDLEETSHKWIAHPEWYTVAGYASKLGKPIGIKEAASYGRRASALCRKRDIIIETTPDPRFGIINVYPIEILEEVFTLTETL